MVVLKSCGTLFVWSLDLLTIPTNLSTAGGCKAGIDEIGLDDTNYCLESHQATSDTMRLSAVGKFGQAWEFLSKNAATDGAGIVDCQYNIQRGNGQERNIKAVSIFKASSMV